MDKKKLPLSVALISFNEEEHIGKILQLVTPIASEVVLVDSNSTDRTVEIALKYGAKVFVEEWKGFLKQKNSAFAKCTQPWILTFDCDEIPNQELLDSIVKAVNRNEKYAYLIQRKTFYLGKLMKRTWQPDWNIYLVRKDCAPRWEGIEPHAKLVVDCPTKRLKGYLIHYSYKNLHHHIQKSINYALISAKSYYAIGKRSNLIKLLVNPFVAFLKLYIKNLGFLDGFRGLLAGFITYFSTLLKYLFLWEIQTNLSNKDE
ncbi:MAG: glycosyltransferase family 2 protein [Ignavibacteria bacterium]|nr:glycosyltransferase family 2 protein [Ignavibacteria bacterium]